MLSLFTEVWVSADEAWVRVRNKTSSKHQIHSTQQPGGITLPLCVCTSVCVYVCVCKCLRQGEGDGHTNLVMPTSCFTLYIPPKATAIKVKFILSVNLMVTSSTSFKFLKMPTIVLPCPAFKLSFLSRQIDFAIESWLKCVGHIVVTWNKLPWILWCLAK